MPFYIFKFIFLFFISIAVCQAENKITHPCSKQDKREITNAIKYYLDHGNSAIPSSHTDIMREQCINNFASAIAHPKKHETDDAIVYLQKTNNKWKVITLGTDFGDTLDKLNIPKKLQDVTNLKY
jgi:hypothetical protein